MTEKKTDNKVENVAKVFGETVKLVKEREVKKVTEKERELRKKALKEKIEGYEQRNRERAAESTDRKVDRKKKSRDQSIKFATETVKEERKYKGKSIRKKELVSTEPKEQLSFEKHSKELIKRKELGKKLNNMGTHKLIHKTTFGSSSEANYLKNRESQVTKCRIGTPTTPVPIVQ